MVLIDAFDARDNIIEFLEQLCNRYPKVVDHILSIMDISDQVFSDSVEKLSVLNMMAAESYEEDAV